MALICSYVLFAPLFEVQAAMSCQGCCISSYSPSDNLIHGDFPLFVLLLISPHQQFHLIVGSCET
jgi:hypothetical protein